MHALKKQPVVEKLLGYCAAVARTSELLFVFVIVGLSIVLAALLGYSMELLHFEQAERTELLRFGRAGFFFMVVVFAPLIETLLLQQLPIVLARRFRMSASLQFAMGAIPFAALHFESGVVTGVAAGIVGGALFSFSYLTFIAESKMKAFWMTATIHALHNLVPFVMYASDLP